MTALWASVSGDAPACRAEPPADAAGAADLMDAACEAWWTTDERYVLRVGAAGDERWYVGELEGDEAGGALAAPASPRPPREAVAPGTRTMLVGRRRTRGAAPAPMRLHVRRAPHG